MKDKYYDINELYVGCLGTIEYLGDNQHADWNKKKSCPYVIYRETLSESLDNCHECIDIFSKDRYYHLNEVSRRKSTLEIVHGKYIIGKAIPLSVVCSNGMKKISSIELKSILCNFNFTDALIKNREDNYLSLLKTCLDDIDLMGDGKVKEYYVDNLSALIKNYTSIINEEEFDRIITDINNVRHELDKEREIIVKKREKVR